MRVLGGQTGSDPTRLLVYIIQGHDYTTCGEMIRHVRGAFHTGSNSPELHVMLIRLLVIPLVSLDFDLYNFCLAVWAWSVAIFQVDLFKLTIQMLV